MKNKMQICWVSNLQTFTGKIYFTIFLLFVAQLALAQVLDDFSDHDFSTAPPWTGDDSRFTVSDNQLKLQAPAEDGVAFLSTQSEASQIASWEFVLKMEFNPSASNNARIYLMSDQANLSEPLNGYFVQVGDSKDEVSLYKQNGLTVSKIIDGLDGILNVSTITLSVRVLRNESEGWQLFTDLGLTGNYNLEGISEDNTFITSEYFGVLCSYTATRSDKFFFDDFNIQGDDLHDETPPALVSLEATSSHELNVVFSEPLDAPKAVITTNYVVSPTVGIPLAASLHQDQKTVTLNFEKHFGENTHSVLTVSGISDASGNVMETVSKEFLFVPSVKTDLKSIIITEIFADPSPSVGLPESEFVEIFNRSEHPFNLSSWKFTDQSSVATLPDFILLPQEYAILTAENSQFLPSEKVLQLDNFPTLNNNADVLLLKDDSGNTLDSIFYSETWYRDDDKSDGGWSLEIIDPDNICSEHENWIASENDLGGTPGSQNSVFAEKPDLTGPTLVSAIPISPTVLQLLFNEKLEKSFNQNLNIQINPALEVSNVSFSKPSLTELQLSLATEIQTGVTYTVTVENLSDCAGNLIQQSEATVEFGLPEAADSLDILINEILFNPRPTGVDFVEIVNRSAKFINLKNWSMASLEEGTFKNQITLSSEDFLLKPGGMLAVTENSNVLKGEYLASNEQNFLQVDHLPTLNDDRGSVAIINGTGGVIDYFDYTKDMHSIFIKDDEGVSLERISYHAEPSEQNWKSGSSTVGFATPGYINANSIGHPPDISEILKVEPEIFNPLGGQSTFALIHYNLEKGGYVANVKVFDSQGRKIKELANNDVVGASGFYRWDGDRDDGTRAGLGYYMIWFEIFDSSGQVQNFQKRVAIAATF